LYLHFPFCAHRCHYCDFSVTRTREPPVSAWVERIAQEAGWWFQEMDWTRRAPLDTVFLGGGTPSLLGSDGMDALAHALSRWFAIDAEATEWTAEANPASFDRKLGEAWRRAGVNRLSLGVQALDDRVLAWLGRLHDRTRALEAVRDAREAGFDQISLDLMFGLPDEAARDLSAEIDTILDLDVPHISVYGLTIEPRTPLAEWARLGRVSPAPDGRYTDEYHLLSLRLRDADYQHYEVSSFARPGAHCRHNWYYWNRSPYLGLGPSAHGSLPPIRTWNVFRWDRYERALLEGSWPLEAWERVTGAEEGLERIWLGLRTHAGLTSGEVPEAVRVRCRRWVDEGWLQERGDRWVATVEGWLRMDSMVTDIAGATER